MYNRLNITQQRYFTLIWWALVAGSKVRIYAAHLALRCAGVRIGFAAAATCGARPPAALASPPVAGVELAAGVPAEGLPGRVVPVAAGVDADRVAAAGCACAGAGVSATVSGSACSGAGPPHGVVCKGVGGKDVPIVVVDAIDCGVSGAANCDAATVEAWDPVSYSALSCLAIFNSCSRTLCSAEVSSSSLPFRFTIPRSG